MEIRDEAAAFQERLCYVQGCHLELHPASGGVAGRSLTPRCVRYRDGERILGEAKEAGPLGFAGVVQGQTPFMSDGVRGSTQRCWAWEEFLIASGIGRSS
jgi:hypothetical protein